MRRKERVSIYYEGLIILIKGMILAGAVAFFMERLDISGGIIFLTVYLILIVSVITAFKTSRK